MSAPSTFDASLGRMLASQEAERAHVWDTLWQRRSIGRIAVNVHPGEARILRQQEALGALRSPPSGDARWEEALRGDLAYCLARGDMPGDGFPSLNVPRFVHGHSQGICDLFGARVAEQPDGNFYVYPLPPDPNMLAAIEPRPLETSRYWGAVEYIRFARAATDGLLSFRGPIMTGPFDTANYLLGTTVLLEWVYTEPAALHALLDRITAVIGDMVTTLQQAAGGLLHAHHQVCQRGGHDFASECRSLVSPAIYEAFEAPYLRRLGERCGAYAIHSCGSWERTIPSARRDPHCRSMNGQVLENDLQELCTQAAGDMTLSIGPSANLHERYLFPSREDFFAYVLAGTPSAQPMEISICEEEIPLWNDCCRRQGKTDGVIAPLA